MGGTPISHRQELRSSASLEERVCGLCAERSIDVKKCSKMQRQSEANLFAKDCIGILEWAENCIGILEWKEETDS